MLACCGQNPCLPMRLESHHLLLLEVESCCTWVSGKLISSIRSFISRTTRPSSLMAHSSLVVPVFYPPCNLAALAPLASLHTHTHTHTLPHPQIFLGVHDSSLFPWRLLSSHVNQGFKYMYQGGLFPNLTFQKHLSLSHSLISMYIRRLSPRRRVLPLDTPGLFSILHCF